MPAKRDYVAIRDLIKEAIRYRENEIEDQMTRNLRWMNGIYQDEVTIKASDQKYRLNLAYEIANTIASAIYNKDPEFKYVISGKFQSEFDKILNQFNVPARKLNLRKIEKSLEHVTEKYFLEMKSTNTNQRAVVDIVWAGFGCTKMGYNLTINGKVQKLKGEDKDKFTKVAESIQYSDLIEQDEPFKIRVNPLDILLPPDARSLDELPYLIQKIYMKQKDALELYGKMLPITVKQRYETEVKQADMVLIYEFHSFDPRDPYVYVTSEGFNGFVEVPKVATLYDGKKVKSPFQLLRVNDGIDSIYPIPDLNLVEDQIRELNFLVTRRVELIKKIRAIYVAKGNIDPKQLKDLKTGTDGAIIELEDPNFDIKQLELLTLGAEFYNNVNAIRAEMFEILGLTDYTLGGATQERKATEAQFVQNAARTRINKRIQMVDNWVFEQADTFVEIMKEFKVVDRVFKIQFSEDDIVEFNFNGLLLKTADSDIQVVPGSTVEIDPTIRLNKLIQLATVAQGFPEAANRQALWKRIVEAAGEDADDLVLGLQPQQALPLGEDGRTPAIPGNVPQQGTPSLTPEQLGALPNLGG